MPLLQNSLTNEAEIKIFFLSSSANASVHFENKLVTAKIKFPSGVIGSGPMKSIPSIAQVL